VGYSYDGSLVTGASFSGAATGSFGHDADGLLTGLGSLALTRGGPLGLQSGVTDGSAMRVVETYDGLGELTSRMQTVQGQVVLSNSYSYDAAGRISQKVEQVAGASHTYAYTYDADGLLTQVARDGTTIEQYTYDANGNRTSRTLSGSAREGATYDVRDRLQTRGVTAYSFDAAGTLTRRGSDSFIYSEMGELPSATVGGKTVTYSYDGLGRRASRTDGGTTQYLYGNPSDAFQVTAVRDPSGTLTVLFYDGDGHLIAFDRGGSRYYVATDGGHAARGDYCIRHRGQVSDLRQLRRPAGRHRAGLRAAHRLRGRTDGPGDRAGAFRFPRL
jgi:YD repeat-containing protein